MKIAYARADQKPFVPIARKTRGQRRSAPDPPKENSMKRKTVAFLLLLVVEIALFLFLSPPLPEGQGSVRDDVVAPRRAV